MTVSAEDFESAARKFLVFAADDYTESFALRIFLRERVGDLGAAEERTICLEILRRLFCSDLLRVGEFATAEFVFWDAPLKGIIQRLDQRWDVDAPPEAGEGPWFLASGRGRAKLAIGGKLDLPPALPGAVRIAFLRRDEAEAELAATIASARESGLSWKELVDVFAAEEVSLRTRFVRYVDGLGASRLAPEDGSD